jgi:lactoylglutathione lyase
MAQLGLLGIGHVALRVTDIERSLAFYRDALGFAEMMSLRRDDGSLWLVYLRITDTQFIELFPDGQGSRAPGREATAINHFCLECADLEKTAAALRAKDIPLTVEPKMGADGNRQCWIEDHAGTIRHQIDVSGLDSPCTLQRALDVVLAGSTGHPDYRQGERLCLLRRHFELSVPGAPGIRPCSARQLRQE